MQNRVQKKTAPNSELIMKIHSFLAGIVSISVNTMKIQWCKANNKKEKWNYISIYKWLLQNSVWIKIFILKLSKEDNNHHIHHSTAQ